MAVADVVVVVVVVEDDDGAVEIAASLGDLTDKAISSKDAVSLLGLTWLFLETLALNSSNQFLRFLDELGCCGWVCCACC